MSGCVPKRNASSSETHRSRRAATIRVPNRRSGDRCAPRRSNRADIHLGSGSTNVRTEGPAIVALRADRVGLTYTKWWQHSRAFSACGERAPASDSTKPTSRARHKTDALRLKHASCFKRREGNLLPRIPQRHTIRVFKTKARSLLLFRRVRFVRAPDPPHYK